MIEGKFASLHPFLEGGEINGRKIANKSFLLALLKADPFEEYHFFTGGKKEMHAALEPYGSLSALGRGAVKIMGRPELPSCLQSNRYAVCHFSDPFTGMSAAMALRNRHSRHLFPITATNHTISYTEYPKSFLELCWGGCSRRDAIGANSRAAASAMEGIFSSLRVSYRFDSVGFGVPRINVVPMGVFPGYFEENSAEARRKGRAELGCGEDTIVFLLFGRITAQDKMDPLPVLRAMRRIRSERPDLPLMLVVSGFSLPGENMPDFLRAAAAGDKLNVQVLPSPSGEKKRELFAAADVFVSPSDNIQETFGLSLLEAGAAGLPCIASDWDGYRDIVEDGVTGLLVPSVTQGDTPGLDALAGAVFDNQHHFMRAQQTAVLVPELAGAMMRLASDAELRARMGRAALERARTLFSWEAVVKYWLDLWTELAEAAISPAEEERLRAAVHPLVLPYGRIFAAYASGYLKKNTMLRCSELGVAVRSRRYPLAGCLHSGMEVDQDLVFQLLTVARREINIEAVAERLKFDDEKANALVLWAVKQDLLEIIL